MALLEAFRSGRKTIACDFDDVLCHTFEACNEMHNELYGTDLTMEDCQSYEFYQCRCWGSREEVLAKTEVMNDKGLLERPRPIEGAREALEELQAMGYDFVLITARTELERGPSERWLERYYPGIFPTRYFTGSYTYADPSGSRITTKKRSKAEICHTHSALLLIDDTLQNALTCSSSTPPIPCLLFGEWEWNRYLPEDDRTYVERWGSGRDEEARKGYRKRDERGMWPLPEGVRRVRDWGEVVGIFREMEEILKDI